MPDFDTRTPQEPDKPSKLQIFLAARRQQISAVGRLRDRIMGRFRWVRFMVRHRWVRFIVRHRWSLGLSLPLIIPFLVVLKAVITYEPPAVQLDQKIPSQPTPAYDVVLEDSDSSAYSCEPEDVGYDDFSCSAVFTKATDEVKLASITEDLSVGAVHQVEFYPPNELSSLSAMSYCFESKDVAVSALHGSFYYADLLGKTNYCYVAVYKYFGPELNPPP
jgi:hypothetical protein